jgi:hypothetical protein
MENLTLTTPITTPEIVIPGVTKNAVVVASVVMDLYAPSPNPGDTAGFLNVILKDDSGAFNAYVYTGEIAATMIQTLNVADCSVKSMHKRILEKLVADGKIPPGTVEGAPSGGNPTGEL